MLNWKALGVLHDDDVELILNLNHLLIMFGRKLNVEDVSDKSGTNKSTDVNKYVKHINNLPNHLWNLWS